MIAVLGVLLAGTVAPIGNGNALTLPAARHLVRMDTGGGRPPAWLLAIQQDGADGHGLWFLRSDDGGASWSSYAPIQDDWSERDTPDLITVGNDIALVYSYEGPTLGGSARHDVFFQWWRWDGRNDWSPSPPVRVFDSTSSTTAYYRGLIALDSVGRVWVQAFRLNTDGTHTAVISVSADGGATFAQQPSLATLGTRAGGRLISLGTQLMFLYGTHGCCDPGRMRLRDDAAPLSTWSSATAVLSDGIYHGAALSAVADGAGGLHLVYKNVNESLYYRRYDGRAWSGATLLEGTPDWALQPAVTRLGDDLVVFYNHMVATNTSYRFVYKTLHGGSFSSATALDSSGGFKGYPAAAETLPTSTVDVPCVFGKTPDASSSGKATLVSGKAPAPGAPPPPPPPPDGGVDGGAPDGGAPDGGAPDGGGVAPPPGTVLFSDSFNRNNLSGLGSSWTVLAGAWITDSRANSDRDALDRAVVKGVACADCRIDARLVGYGTGATGFTLRETGSGDRYDLVVLSNGRVQIRRWRSGTASVLGDAPSGIPDLGEWATAAFTVVGPGPVTLTATVNGALRLTVTDASTQAITSAGAAGLTSLAAGTWFDDFTLTAIGAGGGAPDGGVPDAGSDAGAPDAGSDAGVPDGGSDGGTPPPPPPPSGVLFSDAFDRSDLSGLGAKWTVSSGAYITDSRANADRDGFDQAYVKGVTCSDCRIDARMVGFGTEMALTLRGNTAAPKDRYDLAITSAGRLRIRRWRSGSATVLGDVASGIPDPGEWASFSFTVSGTAPVTLTGAVNGTTKLTVTDGSSAALTVPGLAGMTNTMSGSWVDDFNLTALGTATPPPPGGTPDAGSDGGTPPDGGTDAGTPPDGGPDGGVPGTRLLLDVVASGQNQILAVDQAGTVYSTSVGDSGRQLYASTDGARTWSRRGVATGNFRAVTVLSDETLLAQVDESSGHFLSRSTDHGATWTDVRALGNYMGLTPHSFAELDGAVYFIEYQVFSGNDTPIHLWSSADLGRTWTLRFTFNGTRHAHGLAADTARHALWAFFGDTDQQSRTLRSIDAGATWTEVIHTQLGGQVDATVLADGSLLYGQDITYLPDEPWVVKLGIDGTLTSYLRLPGPGYSMHALPGGGYVLGVARETGGDVYPSGNVSAWVYTSVDGVHWEQVLEYPRLSSGDDVRADVFWSLPDGDLLLELRDAKAFSSGTGYQIVHPHFQ